MRVVVATLLLVGAITLLALVVLVAGRRLRPARARAVAAVRRPFVRAVARLERRMSWVAATAVTVVAVDLLVLLLTWVVGTVLTHAGDTPAALFDEPVGRMLAEHRTASLTAVWSAITVLGGSAFLVSAAIVIGLLWRWRRGSWAALVALSGAYLGAAILFNAGKALVRRPRPGADLATAEYWGQAFPSGHATDAAAFYVVLGLLLATVLTGWVQRVAVGWVTAVVVALVAVSRLYLGAHWTTDVVAGVLVGTTWALTLWWALSAAEQRRSGADADVEVAPRPPDAPSGPRRS